MGDASDGNVFAPGGHRFMPDMDVRRSWEASTTTSQAEALYYLLRGDNVLLCGKAGSGKSWVIQVFRNLIEAADAAMEPDGKGISIAVTASTGVAASLIGGSTIHSWSGLGISVDVPDPDEYDEESGKRVIDDRKWKYVLKRIRGTDILVIDEMSMLPAYFLTNLDKICRMAKRSEKPFGGIQVVMVGDFLQLPPIPDKGIIDKHGNPIDSRLCFFSPSFRAMHPIYCYLDESHRSDDDRLNDLLNSIRSGKVPADMRALLMSRMGAEPEDGKTYTRLYTRNRNVNLFNARRLEGLPGRPAQLKSSLSGPDMRLAATMRREAGIPKILELKPGAVVMLTSNSADRDNGHVNGSMGRVTRIDDHRNSVTVTFNDGSSSEIGYISIKRTHKELVPQIGDDGFPTGNMVVKDIEDAAVHYMPLKTAWAITVHKSQGQTLDGAIIDLSDCFQHGLGYVAISRVHSLDDIVLRGTLPDDALMLDADAWRADRIITDRAISLRKRLKEFMDVAADKRAMLPAMDGRKGRETKKWLQDHPAPEDILADDATAYGWLQSHRAKRRRRGGGGRR